MSKKYEVSFCSCGHIHIMPSEYLDWIQEDYKHRSIIQICRNCGSSYKTFLDEYFEGGFVICGCDVEDTEILNDPNTRIILQKGIQVPIVEGYCADYYINGIWMCDGHRVVVDTDRLIRDVQRDYGDEADYILKAISGYVSGINWKGTKYEIKR